jgi:hypothetical protein
MHPVGKRQGRISMCGIPKAKLGKYVGLLTRAGREVHVE